MFMPLSAATSLTLFRNNTLCFAKIIRNLNATLRNPTVAIVALLCMAFSAPNQTTVFSKSSPWRSVVSRGNRIALHRDMLRALIKHNIRSITINSDAWTPAVVYANGSDPRFNVAWNGWVLKSVPLPSQAYKAARYFAAVGDTDSSLCVIDQTRGMNYSLYGVEISPLRPGLTVRAAGVLRSTGSGWWNNRREPWIGRASGAALCGGLVLEQELRLGSIRHALALGWPRALISKTNIAAPATTTDGSCTEPGPCIPMGTRLALNPSLTNADFRHLGMTPSEIAIARALQIYGAYIVDSSDTVAVYVESRLGSSVSPAYSYRSLPGSLLSQLRVTPRPQGVRYDDRDVMSNDLVRREMTTVRNEQ